MGFSAETIEKVRRASDLVEVAGGRGAAQAGGVELSGLESF